MAAQSVVPDVRGPIDSALAEIKAAADAFAPIRLALAALQPLADQVGASMSHVGDAVLTAISPLTAGVESAMHRVRGAVLAALQPLADQVGASMSHVGDAVLTAISPLTAGVESAMHRVRGAVLAALQPLADQVGASMSHVGDAVLTAISPLTAGVGNVFSSITGQVESFLVGIAGQVTAYLTPIVAEWGTFLGALAAEQIAVIGTMLAEWAATMLALDVETAGGAAAALATWLAAMLGVEVETGVGVGGILAAWAAGMAVAVGETLAAAAAIVASWAAGMAGAVGETLAAAAAIVASWGGAMLAAGAAAIAAAAAIWTALAPLLPAILGVAAVVAVLAAILAVVVVAITACVGACIAVASAGAAAAGAIIGIGKAMSVFVSLANPAAVDLFNLAVDDCMAVIGQGLTPALEVCTALTRMFADSMTDWAPQLGAVIGQLAAGLMPVFQVLTDLLSMLGQELTFLVQASAPAIQAFTDMATAMLGAVVPIFEIFIELATGALAAGMKVLGAIMQAVTPLIVAVANGIRSMFEVIQTWIHALLSLLGLAPDLTKPKAGASTGAAVKGANIGDLNSVWQNAIKSAYSIGKPVDPGVRTASAVEKMAQGMGRLVEIARDILSWMMHPLNSDAAKLEQESAKGRDLDKKTAASLAELWQREIDNAKTPEEKKKLEGHLEREIAGYDRRIASDTRNLAEAEDSTMLGTWLGGGSKEANVNEYKDKLADAERKRQGARAALDAVREHADRPATPPAGTVE